MVVHLFYFRAFFSWVPHLATFSEGQDPPQLSPSPLYSPMPRRASGPTASGPTASDSGAQLPATPGPPLLQFKAAVQGGIMQFYQGLYLPQALEPAVPTRGKLRVIAEFDGQRFERALIPDGAGRHFLILGGDMRRALGLRVGSQVAVRVWADPRADDAVEPCEELAAALALEPRATEKYAHIKPGQRRGLNYYISQGKRPETRAKRAIEVAHKIATDTLYGQLKKGAAADEADQAAQAAEGGSF